MSAVTAAQLEEFQQRIGYRFHERALLVQALTHGSSTADKLSNNERMEFFGDAIIDFIVCERLFIDCPDFDEGRLTEIKGEIVSRRALAVAARRAGMEGVLRLGKGIAAETHLPQSVLANVFEALIAGVYLDGGLEAARKLTLALLSEEITLARDSARERNYKSILQEWTQREKLCTPEYRVLTEEGPEHSRVFTVGAFISGRECGRGLGRSKKAAEQEAAREAISTLIVSG